VYDGSVRGGWGLKCFKGKKLKLKFILFYFYVFKKISIPPSPDIGWWLYRIAIPPPPQRSRRARRLPRGGGGIVGFKKKFKKIKKNLETLQSPPFPDGAVVHDGSSVGVGGLERNRATNQIYLILIFFP
jgi:hypothetical protein